MTQQDLLVLANTTAGSAQEPQVDAAMAALRSQAGAIGATVELMITADIEELTESLNLLAGRRLVVLGGDGSVQAAVQGLYETGQLRAAGPIAIVPLGTGNDLAGFLNIPADCSQAAAAAVQGRPRPMELLVADDGEVAVNAVHVGVGASAAKKGAGMKRRLRRLRLGKLGYRIGAIAAGVSEYGWHLRVTVDGKVVHDGRRPVLMVALGLGRTVGGGAPLIPDARAHDGMVDVVVSRAVGPLARLRYAVQIRNGSHVDRADVVTVRGTTVEVEAVDGEGFLGSGDGEFRGPFTRRRWTVKAEAWQVLTPA